MYYTESKNVVLFLLTSSFPSCQISSIVDHCLGIMPEARPLAGHGWSKLWVSSVLQSLFIVTATFCFSNPAPRTAPEVLNYTTTTNSSCVIMNFLPPRFYTKNIDRYYIYMYTGSGPVESVEIDSPDPALVQEVQYFNHANSCDSDTTVNGETMPRLSFGIGHILK